ncbi:hypothetical protein [Brenneria corticis]|uniref:Glycosyltransferase 52 family protein n=1 Tax=Brenneria corticis TaxID=2173106 RepID=A0A2U1TJZ4_9GAMM|nr:hypothetical protein [Brenneria sp. CFCC 11842]PWC09725.1 hypothetical protein DDT56_23295 [Brenneria sp. CFCC 11842]
MRVNFFILESPLQVASACKVSELFDSESFFFIRLNGDKNNDDLIYREMDKVSKETHRVFFKTKRGSRISLLLCFARLLIHYIRFIGRIDGVFIGHWQSRWMRVSSVIIKLQNIGIVDDGLATISAIRQLNTLKKNRFLLKYLPTFYTSFDINIPYPKIVSCKKKKQVSCKVGSFAIIIGTPLVEKGIINFGLYEKIINNISSHMKSKSMDIIYIPHRAEGQLLDRYDSDIKIMTLDKSVEDYFKELISFPSFVFSFYSTALVNLSEVYKGPSFYSILLDENDIESNFKSIVLNSYEYIFSLNSIKVVPYENIYNI